MHHSVRAVEYVDVLGVHPLTAGPHPLTAGPHPLTAGPHPLTAGPHPLPAGPHPLTAGPHPPRRRTGKVTKGARGMHSKRLAQWVVASLSLALMIVFAPYAHASP